MEGAKEDSPTTLVDILRRRARESGSETVFTFVGSEDDEDAPSLTFAELDARARAIAGELQGQGVVPGDRALLFFQPGLEFIEAFFGCLYAGAIAVPCPPPPPRADRTMARIEGIVESAQPSHVLTHSKLMDRATAAGSLRWLPVDTLGGEAAERWRPPAIDAKSLAFLQYTSGSTSRPRGVRVSHENLVENLAYFARGMSVTAEAVQVTWLPPFHDMGLIAGLLLPIFIGYPCYVMAPSAFLQRPFRWLEAISRYRGTHSYAPNFAYDLCVDRITPSDRARLDLHSWKVALVAAEPVRWQSLQRFAETFEEVGFRRSTFAPGYGLAEATLGVSGGPTSVDPQRFVADAEALEQGQLREVPESSENARPLVACGEIGPRMEVRIVDPEKAAPAAEGAIGEIWVQSPSVPDGYWREPKETEATFGAKLAGHDGVFMRTGDLGFLSGGQLYVTGRIKDLVILQGRNLYPHDVEWTVESAHPALRRAGATAFAVDDGHEERLAVVAELNKVRRGDAADNAEVVAAIRQAVAEQHDASVDRVVLIPAGKLPKTTSGKVQRRATRALLLAGELETVFVWDRVEAQRSRAEAGASPDVARSAEAILVFIVQRIAERLNVAPSALDPHQPISRFGLGSKDAVVLIGELGEWLGRALPATLPWEHPTAAALAAHLAGESEGKAEASASASKARAASSARDERIAVVGMACRFPGASSPEELWSLLAEGGDAVGEVPPTRWKAEGQWGGFIDGIDRFDASHFGISRREAARMDPQQRVLLEVAWEALERSGHAPTSLAGSRTGVFVGISGADHWLHAASRFSSLEAYSGTGNALSIAANRISYFLDLKGPSLAVDTACSSSLVAVHLACRSLRDGETDLAVAAGVNALLAPHLFHVFTQAHMLAADGRCKTFDARADGYVRAEGCGVVVLKRLSDAVAAGDPVLAVIDGTAINQDGRSNGMTAPNGLAQQAVVREALADAKVAPRDVGYVEAHGTGTPLGDPVEVRALAAVIESGGPRDVPCFIGAVKANIGHLESAAGIAGIIKAILCLQKGQVPPQPHLRALNPEIPKGPALAFPTSLVAWPRGATGRVAGVSSFGFGGTNAHVVLSEAPEPAARPARAARSRHLFVLSARTEAALRGLAARHAKYAAVHAPRPEDAAATLSLGRTHLPYRVALVAESVDAWVAQLAEVASGATPVANARTSRAKKRLAFVFTGQGAQYVGMGSGLYRTEPVFREALDRCARILEAELPEPLLTVMFESPGGLLDRTLYTQPALFALEWALAELWRSWGIEPDVVLGHSVGEYVAACVAGVFTLEEALRLLARRARAMQALPAGGAMLSVTADEARVAAAIAGEGRLAIAAVNGPKSVVVSGDAEALGRVKASLEAEGVRTRALPVSHAFHSPLLEPALDALEAEAARIPARKPAIPLVSNLTGEGMSDAPDARYWRRHARETVRFEACLRTLEAHGVDALIELGPQPTLLAFARRVMGEGPLLAPSLERGEDDGQVSFGSLGALYAQGVAIDWAALHRDGGGRRVPLPSHPFEQETFPLELVEPTEGATQHAPPALEAEGGASQPVGAAPATERLPKEAVVSELTAILARLMHADPSQVDPTASLLELGADSIIILEALGQIQIRFGVKLSVRQIFQELTTLAKVGDYVHRVMPPVAASPAPQASSPSRGGGEIDRLAQQLESMARQLESLRSPGVARPRRPRVRPASTSRRLAPKTNPRCGRLTVPCNPRRRNAPERQRAHRRADRASGSAHRRVQALGAGEPRPRRRRPQRLRLPHAHQGAALPDRRAARQGPALLGPRRQRVRRHHPRLRHPALRPQPGLRSGGDVRRPRERFRAGRAVRHGRRGGGAHSSIDTPRARVLQQHRHRSGDERAPHGARGDPAIQGRLLPRLVPRHVRRRPRGARERRRPPVAPPRARDARRDGRRRVRPRLRRGVGARLHRRARRRDRRRPGRARAEPQTRAPAARVPPRAASPHRAARERPDLRRGDHGVSRAPGRRAGVVRREGGPGRLRQAPRRRHAHRRHRRRPALPQQRRRRRVAVRRRFGPRGQDHAVRGHLQQAPAGDGGEPRRPP